MEELPHLISSSSRMDPSLRHPDPVAPHFRGSSSRTLHTQGAAAFDVPTCGSSTPSLTHHASTHVRVTPLSRMLLAAVSRNIRTRLWSTRCRQRPPRMSGFGSLRPPCTLQSFGEACTLVCGQMSADSQLCRVLFPDIAHPAVLAPVTTAEFQRLFRFPDRSRFL